MGDLRPRPADLFTPPVFRCSCNVCWSEQGNGRDETEPIRERNCDAVPAGGVECVQGGARPLVLEWALRLDERQGGDRLPQEQGEAANCDVLRGRAAIEGGDATGPNVDGGGGDLLVVCVSPHAGRGVGGEGRTSARVRERAARCGGGEDCGAHCGGKRTGACGGDDTEERRTRSRRTECGGACSCSNSCSSSTNAEPGVIACITCTTECVESSVEQNGFELAGAIVNDMITIDPHTHVHVCLSGEVRYVCHAGCNIEPLSARACQKQKCMENARTMKALRVENESLRAQADSVRLSADRRARLEWESVACESRMERDACIVSQREAEKRARDADAHAALARTEADHARQEAMWARKEVREHSELMLAALDACAARVGEDATRAAHEADVRLERERARWCKVVTKQKEKVTEVTQLHDAAMEMLEEREAAHLEREQRSQESYDEAARNAANAKRRIANWERRMADTLARMPPMPAKPDSDAVPVEQQTTAHRTMTRHRFVKYLRELLGAFEWSEFNVKCLATALFKSGLLDRLWDTREMDILYFDAVTTLHARMETECFGERFGIFCHLELGLTLAQITLLAQATCKSFDAANGKYTEKVLDYSSHSTQLIIRAPRITPPRNFLEPIIKGLKEDTGLEISENGRVSLRPFLPVLAQLIERDAGRCGTPTRAELQSGTVLDLTISLDATGFGALQVSTLVVMNPRLPQSSANCDILGMGNVSDGGQGAIKLLGPNRDILNTIITGGGLTPTPVLMPDGSTLPVRLKVWNVADLSCARHCEHLLGSGLCCCPRLALRHVPKKPDTPAEMKTLCRDCVGPALNVRQALGHRKYQGRVLACPACLFGHSDDPEAEFAAFQATETRLLNDKSKGHEGRYTKWSLDHAHSHMNVRPLAAGEPTFQCNMMDQLPDMLHMLDLNLPSRPFSHGLVRNCSDEACDTVYM